MISSNVRMHEVANTCIFTLGNVDAELGPPLTRLTFERFHNVWLLIARFFYLLLLRLQEYSACWFMVRLGLVEPSPETVPVDKVAIFLEPIRSIAGRPFHPRT
mmetsp:Transcript_496/g.3605  ORF Transcript_496/g.3605 Transcript_496/m.3605 type:complete len:103 (-) Transcript_496:2748-3056(-)